MNRIHLIHAPYGSLIRTDEGQVGIVTQGTPGKLILVLPYRADATADTPDKAGTYRQAANIYDLVELIKTPTQLALDAALALYDTEQTLATPPGFENELPDLVGEMITIPAWEITGMVQSICRSNRGSEVSIDIMLQEHPDDPARKWQPYRPEPTEYEIA